MMTHSNLKNAPRPKGDINDYLEENLRSLVNGRGATSEADRYQLDLEKSGFSPKGQLSVPLDSARRFSRDLLAGDFDAGGSTVGTTTAGTVPALGPLSLVEELGITRFQNLSGTLAIPRVTSGAEVQWIAEGATAPESDLATDNILLSPKTVCVFTQFSKQLFLQTDRAIQAIVINDITRRIDAAIFKAILAGSGVSGQPKGLFSLDTSTSGVGTVTFAGAPTWAKVASFAAAVETEDAQIFGPARFVSSPDVAEKFRTTTKDSGSGQFILPDSGEIMSAKFHSTSLLASGAFADRVCYGHWSEAILAEWSSLDLVIDPYSGARNGLVSVTGMAHIDVGFRHPEAFAVSTDSGAQ